MMLALQRKRSPLTTTLFQYVANEFIFCFGVAFLFFFSVFFVNQLLLMAEDILSKRAPVGEVLLLLLFATPSILAIACPFAALVGALMASGRLSSDNEILATQAAGIRKAAIFIPFLLIGTLIAGASFILSDIFLPLGTLEFGRLYRSLIVSTPQIEVGPYAVKRFGSATLVTGSMKGKDLGPVLVFDSPASGGRRIISGTSGKLDVSEGSFDATFMLDSIWEMSLDPGNLEGFEWSSADSLEYRVRLRERDEALVQIGPREMSSRDVSKAIQEKWTAYQNRLASRRAERISVRTKAIEIYDSAIYGNTHWDVTLARTRQSRSSIEGLSNDFLPDRSLQIYRLELAKKFSIPAGALCFVFLAFPLALGTKRSGRSVGFGLGLLVSVLYWALLLAGQTLGSRSGMNPTFAMWIPNVVAIIAGGLIWWIKAARR